MSSNSLFSFPVYGVTSPVNMTVSYKKSPIYVSGGSSEVYVADELNVAFGDQTFTYDEETRQLANGVGNLVRASSLTISSATPQTVRVRNASGGFTTYSISGEKDTKITLGPNTVLGNPALLRSFMNDCLDTLKTSGSAPAAESFSLLQFTGGTVKINLVVDSAAD